MKITLTIDNGPEAGVTPTVLDVLSDEAVKATFFVVGEKLQSAENRALVQQAHSQAHGIGNHTFTHSTPFGALTDPHVALQEIACTQSSLEDLIGDERKLFRPCGGGGYLNKALFSRVAYEYLQERKYSCVLWNSVPRDWEDPDGWVDTALADIVTRDWSVIVVHDLPTGAMDHLRRFIVEARERGATFTSEFPTACTPLWRGESCWDADHLIT